MSSVEPEDPHPGLAPPRFGLGSLLFWIAVLCVLLASFSLLGPSGGFALALLVLAVAAHVAGNAIGMRLRHARQRQATEASRAPLAGTKPHGTRRTVEATDFAPTTRLHRRESLGRPVVFVTAAGALLAAILGGYGLTTLLGQSATVASIGLGVLASGVLGAIWTFVGFSFLQVAATALWQASRHK
ncbi:MAG: hypothetical protein J5I93_10600 [Pirellulaceae bacterium]|nr:hypothetical protein [Pirellulaceae bacterium]